MRPLLAVREPKLQVWPSYTDVAFNIILVLMMYLFVQLVVNSQVSMEISRLIGRIKQLEQEISKTSAEMKRIEKLQKDLETEVKSLLPPSLKSKVSAVQDGNLLRLSFSNEVLFASGRSELKDEGRHILGIVGEVLHRTSATFLNIQIEGHTDNVPINTREFPSNWELSSARATTVVRFLQEKSGLSPEKLSATGYSEYRPADAQSTEEAKARNRRIELVVVYSIHQRKFNDDANRTP